MIPFFSDGHARYAQRWATGIRSWLIFRSPGLSRAVPRVDDRGEEEAHGCGEEETMPVRIGEVMIRHGLLTEEQVEHVLREQEARHKPFGQIAEELFGLTPKQVEKAWAHQYSDITEHVDTRDEAVEHDVLALVDRRQAWQFRILPLRRDGAEIMVATVIEHLPRAMRFALRHFEEPCYFVLSKGESLGESLLEHFPMQGMTPEYVRSTDTPFPQEAI